MLHLSFLMSLNSFGLCLSEFLVVYKNTYSSTCCYAISTIADVMRKANVNRGIRVDDPESSSLSSS